jgi:hypothetical protein
MTGGNLLQNICRIQAKRWIANLLWWMENYIAEPPMTYFCSAWIQKGWIYWPSIIVDCFHYYKGCEECQRFGNVQLVLAVVMPHIIKP